MLKAFPSKINSICFAIIFSDPQFFA